MRIIAPMMILLMIISSLAGCAGENEWDTDQDGWSDTDEENCLTNSTNPNSVPYDSDSDGICDPMDFDDDNDGLIDQYDALPLVYTNSPLSHVCIESHTDLVTHIHINFQISYKGETIIPTANEGIQDGLCNGMRAIHTHDDSGKLHIETPVEINATVKDIFEILDIWYNNSENEEVTLNVNGWMYESYLDYELKDSDEIELVVKSI